MKRNFSQLSESPFDVLVIGAGIYGAAVARDAALRGLKVALIDKGDFCGKTSHNSLKIIHGGIRYLQHLNFKRAFESIQDQNIWLEIAPHLVKPMPCIMPTYGYGMRGSMAMRAGITLYQLMGLGRNRRLIPERKISQGRILSKAECLAILPNIDTENLTGAAMWYDAQVFDADRAVIEMVMSAAEEGAVVGNYLEAISLLMDANGVAGAVILDRTSGQSYPVTAKYTINAAGPWAKQIIALMGQPQAVDHELPLTESMNIVTRPLFGENAIALKSQLDSDSVVDSSKRLYFFTPWKGCQAIGTTHFSYSGNPDSLLIQAEEIEQFIDEINQVYPGLNLTLDDVSYCYKGLTPASDNGGDGNRAHEGKILDHQKDGINGLIRVIGVKYTTARLEAEKAVNLLVNKLGIKAKCQTRVKPLPRLNQPQIMLEDLEEGAFISECKKIVMETGVVSLADLILRRMDLAARNLLDRRRLRLCTELMIEMTGWDKAQTLAELNKLNNSWFSPALKAHIAELITTYSAASSSPLERHQPDLDT